MFLLSESAEIVGFRSVAGHEPTEPGGGAVRNAGAQRGRQLQLFQMNKGSWRGAGLDNIYL